MWERKKLKIPATMPVLTCSLLPVHPFIYGLGQVTASGNYLSPTNAINYMTGKLQGSGDVNLIAMMVCAKTQTEYIEKLQQLASVLSLPSIDQVARMAKTAADLAVSKMQIPGKQLGGLPKPQTLSTGTNRLALKAQLIAKAKEQAGAGSDGSSLQNAVTSFSKAREQALKKVNDQFTELQSNVVEVWLFSGKGNSHALIEKLKKDIPEQDAVFSFAVLFVGDDLSALQGMVYEPNHARVEW